MSPLNYAVYHFELRTIVNLDIQRSPPERRIYQHTSTARDGIQVSTLDIHGPEHAGHHRNTRWLEKHVTLRIADIPPSNLARSITRWRFE